MDIQALLKNPLFVFLVCVLGGYFLRWVIFKQLAQLAKKSKTQLDDILISALRGPFIFWFIILGVYLGLQATDTASIPQGFTSLVERVLLVVILLSVTMVAARLVIELLKVYSHVIEGFFPVTSLTHHIVRIVIFIFGGLIIMSNLGISVTPILATLGIGGMAVALALQDTLANLFSGIHISMARQIKVGDYIKLDSGDEGYVVDINWRSTIIRMLPNNEVIVPNAKLAQAVVTNFYLPDREIVVLMPIGVHYDSDLDKVEHVTIEVGREVMKTVQGGVPTFEPVVRYHTFADFSINFNVVLRVKEFADQGLVRHEFVKRLNERYRKESIVIPYPIRSIQNVSE